MAVCGFPFLLVRLRTKDSLTCVPDKRRFPFLLVRLRTERAHPSKRPENLFPFLLVRLRTRIRLGKIFETLLAVSIPFS